MKLTSRNRITALALLTVMAVSAMAVEPPQKVEVGGLTNFTYWFATKTVGDVDQGLSKLGLKAEFCTFQQQSPRKDFSYKGVGPCLLKNFSSSMKTEQLAGPIYVWVKDAETSQLHAFEIQWRPPRGGWKKVIKQYFVMKSEKASKNDSDPLPYSEFIGGDIKITLPEDPAALEVIVKDSPFWLKERLSSVSSVSLHLKPTGRNAEKIVYTGKLSLEQRATETSLAQTHVADIKTDINVVILKRPFFVQSKYRYKSDVPELPSFTEELMP